MTTKKILSAVLLTVFFCGLTAEASSLYETGTSVSGIRDVREVLKDVLYRGGANNGRAPMNSRQLNTLCERGIGTTIYLYNTGFSGPSTTTCSQGSMRYKYNSYSSSGIATIHSQIYETIKTGGKPVFVHCWYGIHATGLVAATALMQFCDMPTEQAVRYWKVGIAPSLQYQKVIDSIRSFRKNPALALSSEEKARVCPQM